MRNDTKERAEKTARQTTSGCFATISTDEKLLIGNYGAIELIMDRMKCKLKTDTNTYDTETEMIWSFLQAMTDEAEPNCYLFLEAEGLSLFGNCYNLYQSLSKKDVMSSMRVVMSNISEVDSLRHRLMKPVYIRILTDFVKSKLEEFNWASNSCAGVLAYMVSDGADAWQKIAYDRNEVMEKIMTAVEMWDLKMNNFISYRSLRPLLRLLPLWHAPANQHWAVWGLASLTIHQDKYCTYVIEEGGVVLLKKLVSDPRTYAKTQLLALIVLRNVSQFTRRKADKDMMERK